MEEKKFDYSELDKFIAEIEEIQKKYPHLHLCIWNDLKEERGHVRIDADILHFPPPKIKEKFPSSSTAKDVRLSP